MKNRLGFIPLLLCLLFGIFTLACDQKSFQEDKYLEAGVSQLLAKERKFQLDSIQYTLGFQIPDSLNDPVRGSVSIEFLWNKNKRDLLLDFQQDSSKILSFELNGKPQNFIFENGHWRIPAKALKEGWNKVEIDFISRNRHLNRNKDYLYTLLVPDKASTVFPCFDQPDLKARFQLNLMIPKEWAAISHGHVEEQDLVESHKRIQFAYTKPISTYLFSFAAGRFQKEQGFDTKGREMNFYHRETDKKLIKRNTERIFELHQHALAWLEEYTGFAYPFDKFDFVALPSFQYGGMEHPGNIFYRASSLFLDENATPNQRLSRAHLIAHETAHMWFGNLVTMKWFNDVWLKEVFANFMAAKIVNPFYDDIDHELRFYLSHVPGALSIDRSQGSHPILQPLNNLSRAGSLYGPIIYQKAPVVMKKLEELIGQEQMQKGLQQYFETYAYSNASWEDLIAIFQLDSDSLDLSYWSTRWVERPGRPLTKLQKVENQFWEVDQIYEGSLYDERLPGTAWWQTPEAVVWPQQLQLYEMDSVLLSGSRITFSKSPKVQVENQFSSRGARNWTGGMDPSYYGSFVWDKLSIFTLLQGDWAMQLKPSERASFFLNAMENLRGAYHFQKDQSYDFPRQLADYFLEVLPLEEDPQLIQWLLQALQEIISQYGPTFIEKDVLGDWESTWLALLELEKRPGIKKAYLNGLIVFAQKDSTWQSIEQVMWRGKGLGIEIGEEERLKMAIYYLIQHPEEEEKIKAFLNEKIKNPDRRAKIDFILASASPDSSIRSSFFSTLKDPENREKENWVLEALRYLHHPNYQKESIFFLPESLELLEEIHGSGDIFFPSRWLHVQLNPYFHEDVWQFLQYYESTHPDLAFDLKLKLYQHSDHLYRMYANKKPEH